MSANESNTGGAQACMQRIGEDPQGRQWFYADNSFTRPGIYYWNGTTNVHIQDELDSLTACTTRLAEVERERDIWKRRAEEKVKPTRVLGEELERTRNDYAFISVERDALAADNARLREGLGWLEQYFITNIDGSDHGYRIEVHENGAIKLFEETPSAYFYSGNFKNLIDAIKQGESWT